MRRLKTLLLSIRLRWSRKTRLAVAAYIKGAANIRFGARCKILDGASIDASRGGLVALGDEVTINRLVMLTGGRGGIRLGSQVEINNMTIVDGTGGVEIGERTLIGPGVRIISYQHRFAGRQPVRQQASDAKPIVIGRDAWIGANAVILAGVTIGEGAVIGAGAVVSKDVPAWSIAAGVPARLVRCREAGQATLPDLPSPTP
jgi:acetyltransferase-like isoleucine patch superfamily enzyme